MFQHIDAFPFNPVLRSFFVGSLLGASIGAVYGQSLAGSYAFTTLAGRASQPGAVDATGANARFNEPWGIATDAAGNVYVADSGNYVVRKITPAGVVTTIAGTMGTTGNVDGPALSAQFGAVTVASNGPGLWGPWSVAVDHADNVFVADTYSHTIRRISAAGQVTTLAGAAGTRGYLDGALATARFSAPWGVAVDVNGVLYIADTFNHVVRRITPTGVISTISGSAGDWGSADGIGPAARHLHPTTVAVDPSGRVFVADSGNTIRRITATNASQTQWETTTVAGSFGTFGNVDATGSAARFGGAPTASTSPGGTTVRNNAGTPGYPPAFPGFSYAINELPGLAADASGNVFVSDYSNSTIRKISAAGVVTTIAGAIQGIADGVGTNARFIRPGGLAIDSRGNLYVADTVAHTIRKGTLIVLPEIQTPPASQIVGVGGTVTLTVIATGAPEPTFQWARNGSSVPNATSASLTLSNVQPAQAGTYTVTVSNIARVVTSAPATVSVVNTPTIGPQPRSQSVLSGDSVTFTVGVAGTPVPSVQWFRDGVAIPGATGLSLVLANVQPAATGDYTVTATNPLGAVSSAPARLTINSSRIVNLSIRTALSGGQPLIIGFVATGGGKSLLLRAVGPTLRGFGVGGAMADPILSLLTPVAAVAASNDNWGTGPSVGQLTQAANEVGAFALPIDSLDAAILATAVDGAMTLQAASRNSGGGIVLVELYDAAPTAASRLANVSARTIVGAGENALFAGFVVSGNGAKTLLIRAIGPTLGAFGVTGVLSDPRLEVFPNGLAIALASNDNWGGNGALSAAFRSVSAFALPASDSADAALLVSLQPGAYTAQVSGVGGLTGEVLLEIYEVP